MFVVLCYAKCRLSVSKMMASILENHEPILSLIIKIATCPSLRTYMNDRSLVRAWMQQLFFRIFLFTLKVLLPVVRFSKLGHGRSLSTAGPATHEGILVQHTYYVLHVCRPHLLLMASFKVTHVAPAGKLDTRCCTQRCRKDICDGSK